MTPSARRRSSLVTTLAAPFLALLAGGLVLALPPVELAHAQGASRPGAVTVVNAEVMVLHASRSERGGIDPAIGNLPHLREPPLSAYNTYRLLDKRSLALPMGTSVMYPMPNGRVLEVRFVEPARGHGFKVTAAINQPNASPYLNRLELTAKPNEPFFVGGQMYHGGSLLLVITLRP